MNRAAKKQVDAFNKLHPVGTAVLVWKGLKDGDGQRTVTTSEAQLLSGHTAVVWVKDVSGCIALSHVEAEIP